MEVQSDFVEPATPGLSYNNVSFWRNEDSGYHTSYTPGSVDCSEISNENLDPAAGHGQVLISGQFQVNYDITPEPIFKARKYVRANSVLASTQTESTPSPPVSRRGVKRSHQDDGEMFQNSVPTPTSAIAGGLQKLKVTASNSPQPSQHHYLTLSSEISKSFESTFSELHNLSDISRKLSYPSTPVKKICRTSCKLSPLRRSNKKLNFAIHSLSCESHGVVKHKPHHKVVRNIQFRPDQKVDIIKLLHQDARAIPPVMKILSYLSNEDICNFKLVSPLWCQVWNNVSRTKKQEFETFLKNEKDNQENKEKGQARKNSDTNQHRSLKEVHNLLNTHLETSTPRSPPGTPRTNKFKKFAKCAQMDQRLQISCVRCHQPSKITVEASGEEWAECTSVTCSYCFCKFCKCDRHPGKSCFKFDLDGPSPSKRKKNIIAAGTKRSKKNLYRLML